MKRDYRLSKKSIRTSLTTLAQYLLYEREKRFDFTIDDTIERDVTNVYDTKEQRFFRIVNERVEVDRTGFIRFSLDNRKYRVSTTKVNILAIVALLNKNHNLNIKIYDCDTYIIIK